MKLWIETICNLTSALKVRPQEVASGYEFVLAAAAGPVRVRIDAQYLTIQPDRSPATRYPWTDLYATDDWVPPSPSVLGQAHSATRTNDLIEGGFGDAVGSFRNISAPAVVFGAILSALYTLHKNRNRCDAAGLSREHA